LLFIAGVALLDNDRRRQVGWWLLGLLLGMSPWITYSWLHFGRFWISDNSWVALSALPAFTRDFPARASMTVFDAPEIWFARVFGNFRGLFWALSRAVLSFSPLIALMLLTVWVAPRVQWAQKIRYGLALLIIGASLAPYALTGFFDQRYFVALLMAWSLTLALLCTASARPLMHGFLAVALCSSLLTGGRYLAGSSWSSYNKIQEGTFDQDVGFLNALHECHLQRPNHTLIFTNSTLRSRYGATFRMKVAGIASNLEHMSVTEKQTYFTYMEPFLIIDDSFDPNECPNHDKQ
jgi:hypothetical protein